MNKKVEELNKEQEYTEKVITLNITENTNKQWSDTKSACETLKVVKTTFEECTKEKEIVSLIDENNQKMGVE